MGKPPQQWRGRWQQERFREVGADSLLLWQLPECGSRPPGGPAPPAGPRQYVTCAVVASTCGKYSQVRTASPVFPTTLTPGPVTVAPGALHCVSWGTSHCDSRSTSHCGFRSTSLWLQGHVTVAPGAPVTVAHGASVTIAPGTPVTVTPGAPVTVPPGAPVTVAPMARHSGPCEGGRFIHGT